jgi:hypothetical protein
LVALLVVIIATIGCRTDQQMASKLPARNNRAAWRQFLKWSDSCEEGFQYPDKNYSGIEIYRLDPARDLVQVTCTLGAYQGYQFYYLVERGARLQSQLLSFAVVESSEDGKVEEHQTFELWGTPAFDARTHTLKVLNRLRGLGDCGTLAVYRFSKRTVRLVSLRIKLECDGKGGEDPEHWPWKQPGVLP